MTNGILTMTDLIGLEAVMHAAERKSHVRRLVDGYVFDGEARSVGTVQGSFCNGDVRDMFLRVTSSTGVEHFWPVWELAEEVTQGMFAVDE